LGFPSTVFVHLAGIKAARTNHSSPSSSAGMYDAQVNTTGSKQPDQLNGISASLGLSLFSL